MRISHGLDGFEAWYTEARTTRGPTPSLALSSEGAAVAVKPATMDDPSKGEFVDDGGEIPGSE